MIRQILSIFVKDIEIELSTLEVLSGMLVFSIICLFIFGYTLDDVGFGRTEVIPAVLWATIAFSGTLGLNRIMSRELDARAMDAVLLAAEDRSVIVFGKLLGVLVFMLITELVLLPVGTVLFGVNLFRGWLLLALLLGSYGYAAAGTLIACMAVQSRAREILLPVLLLPLVLPLLFFVVPITGHAIHADMTNTEQVGLLVIVVYDLIITALVLLLAEFVFDA